VFHISEGPPVIDVELDKIDDVWPMILGILGSQSAWPNSIPPGFHLDMGLSLAKAGFDRAQDGKKYWHMVMGVRLRLVARVEDDLYSASGHYGGPDTNGEWAVTFDFGSEILPKFIAALPPQIQDLVRDQLKRQPYTYVFDPFPVMTMIGDLGDEIISNRNESYLPFVGEDFICESTDLGGADVEAKAEPPQSAG
jgi:hypothetical protein